MSPIDCCFSCLRSKTAGSAMSSERLRMYPASPKRKAQDADWGMSGSLVKTLGDYNKN